MANQGLYGPKVTANLIVGYEEKIQRWEAENELIIQEVINLLQATRPEGELHQNQQLIHQLNQLIYLVLDWRWLSTKVFLHAL